MEYCETANVSLMHNDAPARKDPLAAVEIIKKILQAGGDVNAIDKMGCTALHVVAFQDDPMMPVAHCLLNNGANPLLKDKKGKKARDYCQKDSELQRILGVYEDQCLTLKFICCKRIRRLVGLDVLEGGVKCLEVPVLLQDYIVDPFPFFKKVAPFSSSKVDTFPVCKKKDLSSISKATAK